MISLKLNVDGKDTLLCCRKAPLCVWVICTHTGTQRKFVWADKWDGIRMYCFCTVPQRLLRCLMLSLMPRETYCVQSFSCNAFSCFQEIYTFLVWGPEMNRDSCPALCDEHLTLLSSVMWWAFVPVTYINLAFRSSHCLSSYGECGGSDISHHGRGWGRDKNIYQLLR